MRSIPSYSAFFWRPRCTAWRARRPNLLTRPIFLRLACMAFIGMRFSTTIPRMPLRRFFRFGLFLGIICLVAQLCSFARPHQQPPAASGARILLLPRQIVSGERATLAVLDVNGRLTPGVTVNFSNGDRLTTDATGRALFVAPLNPGVIFGSIAGRTERVATAILSPGEAAAAEIQVSSVP